MPLIKRTVREESGAWSLLKKAAVRASETASSLVSTSAPKLPVDIAGAAGLRNTARMRPARSTTAMTMVVESAASAPFCTNCCTSVEVSGAGGGPGGAETPVVPPQPVSARPNASASTAEKVPESLGRKVFLSSRPIARTPSSRYHNAVVRSRNSAPFRGESMTSGCCMPGELSPLHLNPSSLAAQGSENSCPESQSGVSSSAFGRLDEDEHSAVRGEVDARSIRDLSKAPPAKVSGTHKACPRKTYDTQRACRAALPRARAAALFTGGRLRRARGAAHNHRRLTRHVGPGSSLIPAATHSPPSGSQDGGARRHHPRAGRPRRRRHQPDPAQSLEWREPRDLNQRRRCLSLARASTRALRAEPCRRRLRAVHSRRTSARPGRRDLSRIGARGSPCRSRPHLTGPATAGNGATCAGDHSEAALALSRAAAAGRRRAGRGGATARSVAAGRAGFPRDAGSVGHPHARVGPLRQAYRCPLRPGALVGSL